MQLIFSGHLTPKSFLLLRTFSNGLPVSIYNSKKTRKLLLFVISKSFYNKFFDMITDYPIQLSSHVLLSILLIRHFPFSVHLLVVFLFLYLSFLPASLIPWLRLRISFISSLNLSSNSSHLSRHIKQ